MKKILIVEDDIVLREELAKFLTHSSYQVDVLTDFQDVVSSILLSQVDMVLLDINLPNQNGEIILKKLRLESNVPVIMLTSYNNDSDEVLSMSYGADDYITKPYNPTILLLRMEAIWKRYDKNSTLLNYESIVLNMDRGIIYGIVKNLLTIIRYRLILVV